MSPQTRRPLHIDDPVAGEACHVAHVEPRDGASGRLRDIPVDEIRPNPAQPRKRFDDASLAGLANSIRERGVLQPVIVQPRSAGGYELVAGERRWRASRIAEIGTIPAIVAEPVDAGQSVELGLIENVAREDLGVIEEARTIATLLDELNVSATILARRLGRSRSDIAHTVRLLELPDEAMELIENGPLTKGHGKALLTEPDHCRRRQLARRAAESGWSVRMLEADIARARRHRPAPLEPHPDQVAIAERLRDVLLKSTGCEVSARPYRLGYQVTMDKAAVERLTTLLEPGSPSDEEMP
jgi:ParB family chromosome partitioning protein